MYIHLRPPHSVDCEQACARGCPSQAFHDWLDEPLLSHEVRMHERIRQRREALLRGEIPA